MSVICLPGLGCQSVDIAFKKRQIKVEFFLNLLGLLVGAQYSFGNFETFGNF